MVQRPIVLNTITANTAKYSQTAAEGNLSELIKVKDDGNIRTIRINRPAKKNALTHAMFRALADAVTAASNDDTTNIIVWTGTSDYFCAGVDIKQGLEFDPKDPALRYLTNAFIDCKKPIVTIVNGPAIGIGVTLLGLCDTVYATDTATFWTPFSQLGICAEACSSYTFPRIMGYALAGDMLLFGAKINASQAEGCGLVTKIFPQEKLEAEAWNRIKAMAELPIKSLLFTKDLIRGRERDILHKVNDNEVARILELRGLQK
jgi:peroxisomal 3,2-trans-enoyl-CoA isomerase